MYAGNLNDVSSESDGISDFRTAALDASPQGAANVVSLARRAYRFYVDGAVKIGDGLVVVGWIASDEHDVVEIEITHSGSAVIAPFMTVDERTTLIRTFRPDLKGVLSEPEFGRGQCGFVFHVSSTVFSCDVINVNFNRGVAQEGIRLLRMGGGAEQFLKETWLHTGEAIRKLLPQVPDRVGLRALVHAMDCKAAPYATRQMAACDHALLLNDRVLILNGWIASPHATVESVDIVTRTGRVDISMSIVRYPRPDHYTDYPWSRHEPIGLVCVLEDPQVLSCAFEVEVNLRGGYRLTLTPEVRVIDWIGLTGFIRTHTSLVGPLLYLLSRTRSLEDDRTSLQGRIEQLRLANLLTCHPRLPRMAERPEKIMASVDRAFPLGEHGLLIIGWHFFTASPPETIRVYSEHEFVDISDAGIQLERPDVAAQFTACFGEVAHRCGFAVLVPMPTRHGDLRAMRYDFGAAGESWLKIPTEGEPVVGERLARELSVCIPVSTHADYLFALGRKTGQSRAFELTIEELLSLGKAADGRAAVCELAVSIEGQALLLYGGLPACEESVTGVEIVSPTHACDITARLWHLTRDIAGREPAGTARRGFLALIVGRDFPGVALWLRLTHADGWRQTLRITPRVLEWNASFEVLASQPGLLEHLPRFCRQLLGDASLLDASARAHVGAWMRQAFNAFHGQLTPLVDRPGQVVAAIDRAYALGDGGVLLFGWQIFPGNKPCTITMHGHEEAVARLDECMQPLIRKDVVNHYRNRFPAVTDACGFVAWAGMPSRPGDKRALCFDFGEHGAVWARVPLAQPETSGLALAKEILGMVPEPGRMSHALYGLFDAGLGRAIEALHSMEPRAALMPEVQQFGSACENPELSVIVPLYGRHDFLRHQLAQFASDADLMAADLIYVVDDPSIVAATLALAARYQPLFRVPFRVAWYPRNLGFSGANNVGARLARGSYLVLLNSDVLPQKHGWLGRLKSAIETLPDAGAVGPLLEFADGTVQHAGMYAREDAALPGFLLNTHRGMGMVWNGSMAPFEPPMLTAACLMIRKCDYHDIGGLDENYLAGDFEDADLCLALRKRGKRLWLVPDTRLWHLERQSQDYGSSADQRQMLTLYNAWRYRQKICRGELADPTGMEIRV